MWRAKIIPSLYQSFRSKSSLMLKEEFLLPEKIHNVSRSNTQISKARMNLTENLKKLKLQNEKIYKIGKKRKKIKVQNQTKETAKILDLNKIHKIEDKFYKTTLIKCFTQSCYSKFLFQYLKKLKKNS